MVFDIDVLIVFADRDNETPNKNDPGWVTQFKKFLELMLIQVLGKKPNILIKAEYDNMTSPRLDNVGVLVTILSKDLSSQANASTTLNRFTRLSANPAFPACSRCSRPL
jgi:hypothetical protein